MFIPFIYISDYICGMFDVGRIRIIYLYPTAYAPYSGRVEHNTWGVREMTITVDGIASQLPTMNATELLKLRQLTDMLLGGDLPGTQAQIVDPNERILFEAVCQELAAAGIRGNIAYSAFVETKYIKSWKRGVKVVSEFIEKSFGKYANTEAQRLGLCRVLVQTLIKEFKRNGIPVSIGTLANNIHRIPQTFDRAFPRYLESGLAYLIPKALIRNTAA